MTVTTDRYVDKCFSTQTREMHVRNRLRRLKRVLVLTGRHYGPHDHMINGIGARTLPGHIISRIEDIN